MKTNESMIKELVNKVKNAFILKIKRHEIKYFHPQGSEMPNGSYYQRGGFLKECMDNKNSFILGKAVHGEQYDSANYRGGIIIFSTNINVIQMSRDDIANEIEQLIETFNQYLKKSRITSRKTTNFNNKNDELIVAYSVENCFKGKYVSNNGGMFNEKSISIEINGLSSKSLFKLAEVICNVFRQETVLVKDLNNHKIFLFENTLSLKKPEELCTTVAQ